MIEWLNHNRVMLYTKQVVGKDTRDQKIEKVKWKLERRMKYLDKNYGRNDFLEFVSPDFSKFIDADLAKKTFIIRDTFTEDEIHSIPNYLMRFDKDPEEAILKFSWVGNNMFKIINESGMEKLIDIGTEFKQE